MPASKLDCTRKIFRSVATRYAALTRLLSFGWDGAWKRALVRRLARRPQRLQLRLLRLWIGIWGFLLHGKPEVYTYIANTLAFFPDQARFEALRAGIGFRRIRTRSSLGGFGSLTFCRRAAV